MNALATAEFEYNERGLAVDVYQENCALALDAKRRADAAMRELMIANQQYAHHREMARQAMPAGVAVDDFYRAVGAMCKMSSGSVQGATAPGKYAGRVGRRSCSASAVQPQPAPMAM